MVATRSSTSGNRSSHVRRTTLAWSSRAAGSRSRASISSRFSGGWCSADLAAKRVDRVLVAVERAERDLTLWATGAQLLAQHHAEQGGEVGRVDRVDELRSRRDLGAVDDEGDQPDRNLVEEGPERIFANPLAQPAARLLEPAPIGGGEVLGRTGVA